jgi:hypothetical protein
MLSLRFYGECVHLPDYGTFQPSFGMRDYVHFWDCPVKIGMAGHLSENTGTNNSSTKISIKLWGGGSFSTGINVKGSRKFCCTESDFTHFCFDSHIYYTYM